MEDIKKVLLVINAISNEEINTIKESFKSLSPEAKLKLNILYVKPRLPTCYFHIPSMISLSNTCEREAKDALEHVGEILNVPVEQQWIATGKVKTETLKLYEKLKADYILASSAEIENINQGFSLIRNRNSKHIESINGLMNLCQKTATAEAG